MTPSSLKTVTRSRRSRTGVVLRTLIALTCAAPPWLSSGDALAQAPAASTTLREQVARQFDILPLQNGVALRPRTRSDIRTVQVSEGVIAIDGQPVTGSELRARLGADADLILQVSYLDEPGRRALAGSSETNAPASATVPAAPSLSVPPPSPPSRRGRRSSDRVRFGGSIDVDEGERVDGDVVAIGGSVDVNGHVTGDVVAIGGSLDLGPHAVVEGDVVTIGGSIDRAQGARIDGEVREVGIGAWNFDRWRASRSKDVTREFWRPFGSVFSLFSTLVRVGVLCLLAVLVMMFGRDYVERVGQRAFAEPLKAGAIGFLAQMLFVPLLVTTIILFLVTIVGIPLLALIPFAVLGLMVLALVGFTSIASYVGQWLMTRVGWTDYGNYATTIAGILVIASPLVLARLVGLGGGPLWLMSFGLTTIGFLCEYLAWTIGMGAVALTRFNRTASA